MTQKAKTKLKGLPHSRDCFVCGERNPAGFRGKFEIDENEHIFFRFRGHHTMQGFGTIMHGGLQATILDETMGWATAVSCKRMTVLAEITVRYLKRTPLETDLVVEAWTVSVGSRLIKAEGVIRDENGTIYTKAVGKFAALSLEETLFVDDHLIYHEGDVHIFEDVADSMDVSKKPI